MCCYLVLLMLQHQHPGKIKMRKQRETIDLSVRLLRYRSFCAVSVCLSFRGLGAVGRRAARAGPGPCHFGGRRARRCICERRRADCWWRGGFSPRKFAESSRVLRCADCWWGGVFAPRKLQNLVVLCGAGAGALARCLTDESGPSARTVRTQKPPRFLRCVCFEN